MKTRLKHVLFFSDVLKVGVNKLLVFQNNSILIMRVLLFGATGWIGGHVTTLLQARGHSVIIASARLQDASAVLKELSLIKPDRVVLAAGITGRPNVDWCEAHQAETAAVNVAGTVALVTACSQAKIHITNFATGCIYTSSPTSPDFTETDPPNFFGSFYSRSKIAAELATRDLPYHLLLRVRMPITADGADRCLLTKLARYDRVSTGVNSMSVLPTLLPLAVQLLEAGDIGVWNFVNPGRVTPSDLLNAYRELVDPDFTFTAMSDDEPESRTLAAKRSNTVLSCAKLAARFPIIPDALTAVRALLAAQRPRLRTLFRPARMLVTGGAGFIGSNFVHYLHNLYPELQITVVDVLAPCASKAHLDHSGAHFVHGDIGDVPFMLQLLRDTRVDTVVHFAAQTHVDASFTAPLEFTRTNVLGTHGLLEAVRQYGALGRFVHISTDEVYGETKHREQTGMPETRLLLPTNPYAASKVGAEALVHAYMQSYALPAVILRCNNVYGPRQYPEKVVPRFILRLLASLPLQIQGSGTQRRHFLYVNDACAAVQMALTRGTVGETYNVGSDTEVRVCDLAAQLTSLMGLDATAPPIELVADRMFNDQRYWVSDVKLRALGWAPRMEFSNGLQKTVAWYTDLHTRGALSDVWPSASSVLSLS